MADMTLTDAVVEAENALNDLLTQLKDARIEEASTVEAVSEAMEDRTAAAEEVQRLLEEVVEARSVLAAARRKAAKEWLHE